MTRVVATVVLLAVGSCRPRASDTAEARSASIDVPAPILDAVHPDSAVLRDGAVVTVTLLGSGFDGTQDGAANTIVFGTMSVRAVRANPDGTVIRFTVPGEWRSGEAPAQSVEKGRYEVRVRTSHGTSNSRTLRVIR